MKTYDLYMYDPDREVIMGWHRFDAVRDQDALELAEGLVRLPPAELWQETTLVKRWDRQP